MPRQPVPWRRLLTDRWILTGILATTWFFNLVTTDVTIIEPLARA